MHRYSTAYEVFLECQSEDCSEEASLILAEGDFPDSPEEVDDLMYDVYQWFRKNAATSQYRIRWMLRCISQPTS